MIDKILIANNLFLAKIVYTNKDIEDGMMYIHFDRTFNAMFFILPEYRMQNFWMKGCIIPLDVIFIDNKFKITKIYHSCLPCNQENWCKHYEGIAKYAIEVEGGTCKRLNITENQYIQCSLIF